MASSDTRQVATRISLEHWEILRIGLVLEGAETMQDFLRPVVEKYAEELQEEPEVREIAEKAERYRDRKRGVRRLKAKGQQKPAATKRT